MLLCELMIPFVIVWMTDSCFVARLYLRVIEMTTISGGLSYVSTVTCALSVRSSQVDDPLCRRRETADVNQVNSFSW